VSLADLKARMGHDSIRAAMIYQHAAAEADQKIANTLDQRIEERPGRTPHRRPRPQAEAKRRIEEATRPGSTSR
jgi:hypothetical protein